MTQDDADESTPLTYFNYAETSEYESNITNITDRNGENLEIVSNMQGDIIRTTNQNDETVVNNYDSAGNIINNSVKLPSVIRWIVCTSNRHNKRAPICGMIGLTTKQSSPTKEGALYV